MTTTQTTCPDCKAVVTHAETITDLSGPRPIPITVHRCPDCGKVWQTIKQPVKQPANRSVDDARIYRD